jgi:U3 small nucleolar ribonucleoprotein protein IMP4
LDPEIANDKQLRQDYDYDVSRDVAGDDSLDIDDEYSELSGVVGTFRGAGPLKSILSGGC